MLEPHSILLGLPKGGGMRVLFLEIDGVLHCATDEGPVNALMVGTFAALVEAAAQVLSQAKPTRTFSARGKRRPPIFNNF